VTEFSTGTVLGGPDAEGRLVSYDERVVPFDLAVVVPLHGGADYVGRSPGLGDELGFVPVDPHTLQAKVKPNVFALGDAADVPAACCPATASPASARPCRSGARTARPASTRMERVAGTLMIGRLAGERRGRTALPPGTSVWAAGLPAVSTR
jgi:NADPH-dependent 2,4-dienoyl-CoA reductase/sulfur reductase-like enzyme